jgi:hypothetical protein
MQEKEHVPFNVFDQQGHHGEFLSSRGTRKPFSNMYKVQAWRH